MSGNLILAGSVLPTSGVPQGSNPGSIFFLIFVNDLPQMVSSMLYMLADDTKLYHPISYIEPLNIIFVCNGTWQRLVDWCDRWQMSFNVDKCQVMSIGNFLC